MSVKTAIGFLGVQKTLVVLCFSCAGLLSASLVVAEEESAEMAPKEQSHYIQLSPSFLVNLNTPGKRFRYLKADVALRVHGDAATSAIEHNKPLIQHSLVMLLSQQEVDNVSSAEGMEALKTSALDEVMHALESEVSGVEVNEVLFTNFLVE